jgi:DNA-binding response OmpR family regulator
MPNSAQISLLLVEDNLSLRNELADYLRDDGFQVATASDGVEMNFALEQKSPPLSSLT